MERRRLRWKTGWESNPTHGKMRWYHTKGIDDNSKRIAEQAFEAYFKALEKEGENMNSVNLMGRLTRDPEARTTQSGQSVASFTLAVDRITKGPKGEKGRRLHQLRCLREDGRSRLHLRIKRAEAYCSRPDSNRQLYRQEWKQTLHDKCCLQQCRICREEGTS